jgi:hypothetical protein
MVLLVTVCRCVLARAARISSQLRPSPSRSTETAATRTRKHNRKSMVVDSFQKHELREMEGKILKKYEKIFHECQNSTMLPSDCMEGIESEQINLLPSIEAEGVETSSTSSKSSESCKIAICADCGGVGKKYETTSVGQPGGVRRVIESCCTVCQGQCYVSSEDQGTVSNESRPAQPRCDFFRNSACIQWPTI